MNFAKPFFVHYRTMGAPYAPERGGVTLYVNPTPPGAIVGALPSQSPDGLPEPTILFVSWTVCNFRDAFVKKVGRELAQATPNRLHFVFVVPEAAHVFAQLDAIAWNAWRASNQHRPEGFVLGALSVGMGPRARIVRVP